jgi:WD40 repeat protein
MVDLARSVARQSLSLSQNPDLQGLLAYQAYQLNAGHQGLYYDKDIYSGLYAATKKLISPAYNIYPNVRNTVKDISWLENTGSILIVNSDGTLKILSGTLANRASQITLRNTGQVNECLAVSPDEKVAVVGTNGAGILFVELENQGEVVQESKDGGEIILFLKNLGRSGAFLSVGTDNRIMKWDYRFGASSVWATVPGRISSLEASRDGKRVAFGLRDGKLYETL